MRTATFGRTLAATLLALIATGGLAGCSRASGPEVTIAPGKGARTFGDVMTPASTTPWRSDDLAVAAGGIPPTWPNLTRTRWDADGAFTHSQQPQPAEDPASAIYRGRNGALRNADISFTITAQHFALAFAGGQGVDAMVWIDGRPVAAQPLAGVGAVGSPNWVAISLPKRDTVHVRFAGPPTFSGVDTPAAEAAVITAAKPRVTLGVLSDSYYELCPDAACMSRNAAPELATLTGFRVWNMAEAGTGYVNPGRPMNPGYTPSPFGSKQRLEDVENAPIDALLIGGSINDALAPVKTVRAAVDRLLDALASARPDLPVVLLGIEPLPGQYQASVWKLRGAALTKVLRSMVGRHDNVVAFIDPYSRPWITGTGSIARTTGDGNADRYIGTDLIHPSAAGMHYYQSRVAAALRKVPFPRQTPPA